MQRFQSDFADYALLKKYADSTDVSHRGPSRSALTSFELWMRVFVLTTSWMATHRMFIRSRKQSTEFRKSPHWCPVLKLLENLRLITGPLIVAISIDFSQTRTGMEPRFVESAGSLRHWCGATVCSRYPIVPCKKGTRYSVAGLLDANARLAHIMKSSSISITSSSDFFFKENCSHRLRGFRHGDPTGRCLSGFLAEMDPSPTYFWSAVHALPDSGW